MAFLGTANRRHCLQMDSLNSLIVVYSLCWFVFCFTLFSIRVSQWHRQQISNFFDKKSFENVAQNSQ